MADIAQARASLILDEPFLAGVAYGMVLTPDPTCDTAWTDGPRLGYNPVYVAALPLSETVALVAHETMHVALLHHLRRDGRGERRWNVACDHAVNLLLRESGMRLPAGALCDSRYAGRSAEEIYALLPAEEEEEEEESSDPRDGSSPQGDGRGPAPWGGEVRDCPAEERAQEEVDAPVRAIVAAQDARAAGSLVRGVSRAVTAARRSVVDWPAVLRRWVSDLSPSDYSWVHPSVRYLSQGLYLPALRAHTLGALAVTIDTSGSIGGDVLARMLGEVEAIVRDVEPAETIIIPCHAAVDEAGVMRIPAGESIPRRPMWDSGGTDFRPPFAWLEREGIVPAGMVYLTDGETYSPWPAPSDYPVLWAVTDRRMMARIPWGEAVYLDPRAQVRA